MEFELPTEGVEEDRYFDVGSIAKAGPRTLIRIEAFNAGGDHALHVLPPCGPQHGEWGRSGRAPTIAAVRRQRLPVVHGDD